MTQDTLFKSKTKVELKESYGGFEVNNADREDFNDIKTKYIRMGDLMVAKFPSYDEAKKSFEEEVKKCFNSEVVWLTSKFQDQQGDFWLNGIKIHYELRTHYISTYHFEFNSDKPNALTSTGYMSNFPVDLDSFNSVKEYIEWLIKGSLEENKIKDYNLKWLEEHQDEVKERTLRLKEIVLKRIQERKSKCELHSNEVKNVFV